MIEPLEHGDARPDTIIPKINEIIIAVNNQRRAIESMAIWLVQLETDQPHRNWTAKDAESIAKILDGTMETEEK